MTNQSIYESSIGQPIILAAQPVENGVPTEDQANNIFNIDPSIGTNPQDVFANVGANVANFMLIIAGIVVVFMVIYSGFLMVTSGGDEAKVGAAKKQLVNALLATAVITLTFGIVQFIMSVISKPNGLIE